MSKLTSISLNFKSSSGRSCHLDEEKDVTILSDQSEETIPNSEVNCINIIDGNISHKNRKNVEEFDISRSKEAFKIKSDIPPQGGVPPLSPKIERHRQEILSENVGTTPPLAIFKRGSNKNQSSTTPKMQQMSSGKKFRGKRAVSKKISPKRETKPELKRLFDKIRAKKEAKEAAKSVKGNIESQVNSSNSKLNIESQSKETKENSVKVMIKNYEDKTIKTISGEERSIKSPSIKFRKESRVDKIDKIGSSGMKNAASPSIKKRNKKKLEIKIKSVVEKLSKETPTYSSTNPIQSQVLEKKSVSKVQRTIMDIWGPEVSTVGPRSDH